MDTTETQRLDRENPWPGLTPFSEAAQEFFHGRDEAAAELFRRIRRDLLTVLYGKSGLGKTSLLNAGLFPLLRGVDFLPVYVRLDFLNPEVGPIAQIATALRENLATWAVEGPYPTPGDTLWGFFHDKTTEFWSRRNRIVTPVLVLDQFEEIFTLGQATPAAAEIVAELAALIENRPPDRVRDALERDPDSAGRFDFAKESCKVVIALREDFLPELESLQRQIPSIASNHLRLTRMNGRQARDVILRSGGHLVAEGVADRIIAFVATSRERTAAGEGEGELEALDIEPALLSIVCRELNNKRRRAGQQLITEDLLVGAQNEIVADFYRSCLAGLDPRVELFIEDQLLTSGGYRDSRPLDDALRVPGVTREAIDTLIGRRLLRIEERFGTQWVELTHDLLTEVIRQQRDTRREAQEAEAQRERAERAEAEAKAQAELAQQASVREHAARNLVRRTRIALAATAAMLLVAVGALGYAAYESRIADQRAAEADKSSAVALKALDLFAEQQHNGEVSQDQQNELLTTSIATFGSVPAGSNPEPIRVRVRLFLNLADIYLAMGRLNFSLEAARAGEKLAEQLPDVNDERASDVAYAHTRIGDVLRAQGNLTDALTEFRADQDTMLKLLAAHPDNIDYEREISVSHDRIGDILNERGDRAGALVEYRAGAAIREKLLSTNQNNRRWQLDASISHRKIGDALHDQKKLDEALIEYKAGLDLADQLVQSDPTDTDAEWQRGTMHERIGEILHAKGETDQALVEYRAELDAMQRLVGRDPGNAQWQRDYSLAHAMVGNLLYDKSDFGGALSEYNAELEIAQKLAAQEPANAHWQRDLFIAYEHIGLTMAKQGNLQPALEAFEKAEVIAKHLKEVNPTAADSTSDLTWVEARLAETRQRIAGQGAPARDGDVTPRSGK